MNWHSQGSIKGIAITALGYGKLDRRIKALGTKAQLYYMRNIGDWVSFIAAQGMPTNTNGYWHDNVGYNDDNYELDEGMYKRKIIKIMRNGKEEEIAVPNYEYKIGEMDGKDMRSIIERWEDKRTQEKWYGGK